MLTSTEATASRQYSVSLRDALDIAHVENFMDRLIATLMTYERTGQFQNHGMTSSEVGALQFRAASGQGYNRNAVENIRIRAIEALGFYEQALSAGNSLARPSSTGTRAHYSAANSAAQDSGLTRSAAHQPYAAPQNDFRPPTHSAPARPFSPGDLGFDVPVLEDTISAPIRRPKAVSGAESATEPALFTSELALIFDPAEQDPSTHNAAPVEDVAHNGAFSDSSLSNTGIMDTGDQQATSVEYEAILSPAVFHGFEASPKIISMPRAQVSSEASANVHANAQVAVENGVAAPLAAQQAVAQQAAVQQAAVQQAAVQQAAVQQAAVQQAAVQQAAVQQAAVQQAAVQQATAQQAVPRTPNQPYTPTSFAPGVAEPQAPTQPSIATGSPVQAPTVQRSAASPDSPQSPHSPDSPLTAESPRSVGSPGSVHPQPASAPQVHSPAQAVPAQPVAKLARPKAPIDPENPPAISGQDFLAALTQVLRTKEVLAERNPRTHSAEGTIRVNTTQGTLEVTAVRLHSNGQIYLETKKP